MEKKKKMQKKEKEKEEKNKEKGAKKVNKTENFQSIKREQFVSIQTRLSMRNE